jgi:hypothetical protein
MKQSYVYATCLIPNTSPLQSLPETSNQAGGNVDTQEIVKELKAERARLDRAIAALDGANTTRTTVGTQVPASEGTSVPRKRHHLTAAGRKRLSMLMKKRWAKRRKKNLSGRK